MSASEEPPVHREASQRLRGSAPEILISNIDRDEVGDVSDYFRKHNLENLLTDLLCRIGEELPDDPAEFMCSYIRRQIPSNQAPAAAAVDRRRFTVGGQMTSTRSIALHRVSQQLEKENVSIHSFVQGWIDRPELLSTTRRPSQTRSEGTPRKDRHSVTTPSLKAETIELFRDWHKGERESQASLEHLLSWELDVLGVDEETLALHALSILDLWGFFNQDDPSVGVAAVDISRMQGFLSDLYHHYHSSNPYHNFQHAFSVMSAVGNLLRLSGADEFCSGVEELALLVASLAHDVGHSGLNNDYYVKKKHALAIRYNDQAVLESMHSSLAFELILKEKNNFLADWDEEAFAEFRKTAIAAILATDMKVHFDLTTQMQDLRSTPEVDTSCPDTKILVHKCLVHAADISNPVLPTSMYEAWAQRVATEFYRQSEREKSEGLPTAPFMDSSPDDRAEFAVLQLGFMNFVVAPLWNAMVDMWPQLEPRRKQLAVNVEYFKKLQRCAEEKDSEEGSPE
ncbi:hypothetical protein FOZ62_001560 [Perkinsus olseni]|uniref:Phosphodiesterase n=1 Tax=Perkinsus olseni TaxID=32597 RepID=A0A7J6TU06_PEROL|nr:hypothetical protein FOZ62_001560 [Perkinsus olseni]